MKFLVVSKTIRLQNLIKKKLLELGHEAFCCLPSAAQETAGHLRPSAIFVDHQTSSDTALLRRLKSAGFTTVSLVQKNKKLSPSLKNDPRSYFILPVTAKELELFLLLLNSSAANSPASRPRSDSDKLFKAIDQTDDAVFITDRNGIIEYVNLAFEKNTGYTREEVIGQTPRVIKSGLHDLAFYQRLWNTILSGKVFREVQANRKKNGELIHVEHTISPIRNEAGEITHFVGTWKEVNKKREVEYALVESEKRFRTLMEDASDGIFISDAKGYYTEVNLSGCRLLGFDSLEILSMNATDLIHPGDWEVHNSQLNDFSLGNGKAREIRLKKKDGSYIYTEISAKKLPDGRIQDIVRDITERKKAYEELLISQSSYRGILDSITEAVYLQDENGQFMDVNRAAVKMYGYPREYFIGRTPEFVSAPGKNDLAMVVECVGKALAGTPQHFEFWGIRKNGSVFPKDVSLTPGMYFGKKVVIAVARDITERKQTEKALQESEKLLRESQIVAGMGSYVLDISSGIWTSSDILDNILGIDHTFEHSIEGWTSLLHPHDRQRMLDYFTNEVIGKRTRFDNEYRILRNNDHAERWVHGLGELEIDAQDRLVKMIGTIQDITERKQAENLLRDSEEKFRALFENAEDGIFQLNSDSAIVALNESFARMHGYAVDELMTMNLKDLNTPDTYRQTTARMQRVMAGESLTFEVEHLCKNGQTIPLEVSASLVTISGQKYVLGFHRDARERKHAENALRENEMKYRMLVENSPDAIAIYVEGKIVFANTASIQMMHAPHADDLLGKPVIEFVHPDYKEFVKNRMMEAMKGGKALPLAEEKFVRPDGSEFDAEVKTMPVSFDNKPAVQLIIRDITERKKMEAIVKSNELKFRTVADFTYDWEYWESENKQIVYMSPSCERMTGYTQAEFISDPELLLRIVHPEDAGFMIKHHNEAYSSRHRENIDELDIRIIKKDGSVINIYHVCRPIFDENRKFLGRRVSNRDNTERKLAEKALRENEETFRRLFEESTDPILMLDDTGFTDCNQSTVSLLGYRSKHEFLNKKPWELSPERQPDGRLSSEKAEAMIAKALADGYHRFDWIHTKSDGTDCPVEVMLTSIVLKGKQSYYTVWRDIAERKQNEEKLRQLSSAVEQNPASIVITDTRGTIQYVNPYFTKVTGYTKEEAAGKNPRILKSGEMTPEAYQQMWKDITEGRVWRGEFHNRRKNGELFWEIATISPIKDDAGRITHFVAVKEDISERKQAEESLRQAEEKYHDIFDHVTEGIFQSRSDGRLIVANQSMARILGYSSPSELLDDLNASGQTLYAVPGRRDEFLQILEQKGRVRDFESEVFRKDGSRIWISEDCRKVVNSAGALAYYEGTLVDITDRKQAEAKLKETLREFETLVEGIPDSVFFKDGDGRWLITNAPAKKLFRLDGVDWYGKTDRELASIQPQLSYVYDQCISLDEATWRNCHKTIGIEIIADESGNNHYLEVTKIPLFDDTGGRLGLVIIGHDITLQRQDHEIISDQALILDGATDAILLTDFDYRIIYWNKGAEKLYGWDKSEAIGQDVRKLMWREILYFAEASESVLQKGEWSGEVKHVNKKGTEITVVSRLSLVKDANHKPKSILIIVTDITEQRSLERQFHRAQRMDSIGRMAGGIAHDLNNILSPILMSVQLFKDKLPDSSSQGLIHMLESNVHRGADLMRKLLMFTRGVEGEHVKLDAGPIILEIEKIIRSTFPKNISVVCNVSPHLWPVKGDSTQLHQILLNLLVNARDAMPHGGQLSLEGENIILNESFGFKDHSAPPGNYIVIKVTDTGTGIPPDSLDQIFEPFYTTKDLEHGTGLGLSTVAAIVKAHGGEVRVYSEVGRGTQFKIYLPAAESPETLTAGLDASELRKGNGELILVVDDELPIRKTLGTILQAYGYHVISASDGAEATALFVEHADEIRAVITDMSMPIVDGLTLIRTLRNIRPDVKVIAMSGLPGGDRQTQLKALNINAFLMKPYPSDKILEVLNKVLYT